MPLEGLGGGGVSYCAYANMGLDIPGRMYNCKYWEILTDPSFGSLGVYYAYSY